MYKITLVRNGVPNAVHEMVDEENFLNKLNAYFNIYVQWGYRLTGAGGMYMESLFFSKKDSYRYRFIKHNWLFITDEILIEVEKIEK